MARTDRSRNIPHWYAGDDDADVLSLTSGEGARVTDDAGDEYLDFMAQLYCVNAGHSCAPIVDAMTQQAREIPYVSSSKTTPARDELAARLADRAPGSLNDVFFSISGSEANESAIQIAREYQDASTVLTRWRSYHGSTYAAGGLSGDPETRSVVERHAATTGVGKFLPPMVHNSPFDGDTPDEIGQQAADHLEFVIKNEGPDSVAAVLTEPVAGTSGAYPAPPGYFERVREICDEYDVLLIADEVISGFGRCGDWFGIGTEGVEPDMITFAKGVTSAYAPLAGVLADEEIAAEIRADGHPLGQTFAGHPVACAAGNAAMDAYADGLIENCRELAPYLEQRLRELEARYGAVADVHGRGLLWSVEFGDPETGEPFVDPRVERDADNPVEDVREVATDHGVLFGSGRPDTQVLCSPPLCIDRADIDEAVDALATGIEATF
ncbi:MULTISPECIES: aminotransferase family protein [Halolamina]|uniref:Taurine---2-oxoglutarate transaminase n=1 Tax=Halolamina pelagica TaxID=699431 RepID=A0A1I5PZQ6_9EURY|nr:MULTISPECIES: aminotransferase class III-fold pyridoxal phosphate-dependent enzyme [Halolamina]NHX35033.1 aspartate aminotransferase family protein [Halolamina sp. R1-12]SFP39553.1 taurine---2-oxoglutarate transaminase [Halolamina pelagica]